MNVRFNNIYYDCVSKIFYNECVSELKKGIDFAKGKKNYRLYGNIRNGLHNNISGFKMTEVYKNIVDSHILLKKETKPIKHCGDKAIRITRSDSKGNRTETIVDSNKGIKLWREVEIYNPKENNYICTRYIYNENGTKPTIVAQWVKTH
ncbi:hypothetical protein IKQ21_07560 [bacterium]|nr:hypothetical protein [bacterium]